MVNLATLISFFLYCRIYVVGACHATWIRTPAAGCSADGVSPFPAGKPVAHRGALITCCSQGSCFNLLLTGEQ